MTTRLGNWVLERKKLGLRGILAVFLLVISFMIIPLTAYAWSWDEVLGIKDIDKQKAIAFLSNDWIVYANFMGSIIQALEGWTIKGLLVLVSLLEALIPQTFSLFDLLEDAGLNEFAASMIRDLFLVLLVLIITCLGIRTIIFHKSPNFKSVTINVIVMVGLLGGLNELMANMQDMSTNFYKGATGSEKAKEGLAWDLVKHNTADLVYLSQKGFGSIKEDSDTATGASGEQKNDLTKDMYLRADLADLITPDVVDKLEEQDGIPEETQYLAYKITNDGSTETIEEIDSSMFNPFGDSFQSGYVRYPMKFFTIFLSLLALGIAYLFTLFVFVMTIFEIAMKKVVAPFVFITDIETGQKTKMVLQDIMSGFLMLAFTGLSLRFYTIAVNYLVDAELNALLYVIAMMCLTTALIKGSESIMKYFGVDVGLKDGKNHVMGAIGALTAANSFRKGVSSFGRNAVDKLKGGLQQSRENTPKRSEGNPDDQNGTEAMGDEQGKVVPFAPNGMQRVARNTGATVGYMKNRGAGGMLKDVGFKASDAFDGALEKGKDKVSDVANGVKDNVMGTIGEFKGGQAEGRQRAQENTDRELLGNIGKEILRNINSGKENSTASGAKESSLNIQRGASIQGNTDRNGAIVSADSDMNVQDITKGTETAGSLPAMPVKLQNQQREVSVKDAMTGTEGQRVLPTMPAPAEQNMQRNVGVQDIVRGTEGQGVMPTIPAAAQVQQREVSVQDAMRGTEGQRAMPTMPAAAQVQQREVNVQDAMRGTEGQGVMPTMPAAAEQNMQRNVGVQDIVRGTEGQGVMPTIPAAVQVQQREVSVQDAMRGTEGQRAMPTMPAAAQVQQREVNVQDAMRGTEGQGVMPTMPAAAEQNMQRNVNVQDALRGNGTQGAMPTTPAAAAQVMRRNVSVQDALRGNGNQGVLPTMPAGEQTVQRNVNVQDALRGNGNQGAVPTMQGVAQMVQRNVNVQDAVRGNGSQGTVPTTPAAAQTVQRDVNVQDVVRGNGGQGAVPTMQGVAQTVQRNVNVQDAVRGNGSQGAVPTTPAAAQTVQRDVNVQDAVRGNGSQGVVPTMQGVAQTVQRNVNVQDAVRGNGSQGAVPTTSAAAQTVQRDVNVQDAVRSNGSQGAVPTTPAAAQTVQRDVNVQDTVRSNGSQGAVPTTPAAAQTVQRDVNVQTIIKEAGKVGVEMKEISQTIHQDVSAKNNVRDDNKPRFKQRGSTTNHVAILQER